MQDDDLIGKELNEFFECTLNIKETSFITNRTSDDITDPIDKTVDKVSSKFYPSILLIQKQVENHNISLLKTVEISDIKIEMNNVNANKAETNNSIPPKILEKSSKLSASALHKQFNDSIEKSEFPQNLDLADITHIYKNNDPSYKANCKRITRSIKYFQNNSAKTN